MGLLIKAEKLDSFLIERHLEKEFTKEWYDFNGVDYDGVEVNIESYVQTFYSPDGSANEVNMVFEDFQTAAFQTALNELRNSFVEEYVTSYISLAEKIAYGTSLKLHLEEKLEKFRGKKTGVMFAPILSDFISALSIQFVEVIDSRSGNNSFHFHEQYSHKKVLNKLYKLLISEELISKETKEHHFFSLFQNKEVEKPVAWVGTSSSLKLFIQFVNNTENGFEDKGDYKWRIAVKCFVKVSQKNLRKITYTNLRTYKITDKTKLVFGALLEESVLKI